MQASRAVDSATLLGKVSKLKHPDSISDWIVSFLCNPVQCVKLREQISQLRPINRSIAQGSGVGPLFYAIMESDLNPCSTARVIFKYANYINLLVPAYSDVSVEEEVMHIKQWADANKMAINLAKPKELVFRRPNLLKPLSLPFSHERHEHVTSTRLLGIIFQYKLSFDEHVTVPPFLKALVNSVIQ